MNTVEVRDLTVGHRRRRLVGPVSFSIPAASAIGLCGPSGIGKTTVLRALVGLLPSELKASGTVKVLNTDILSQNPAEMARLRSRAVLVPQTPVVFPDTILANAMFGLRHVVRANRSQLQERAEAALVETGLWNEVAERLKAPAVELSQGQRQRLSLARALALDPELILLDEPTSALDEDAAGEVETTLRLLNTRSRTLLVVSHDLQMLKSLCAEVVTLDSADDTKAGVPGRYGQQRLDHEAQASETRSSIS